MWERGFEAKAYVTIHLLAEVFEALRGTAVRGGGGATVSDATRVAEAAAAARGGVTTGSGDGHAIDDEVGGSSARGATMAKCTVHKVRGADCARCDSAVDEVCARGTSALEVGADLVGATRVVEGNDDAALLVEETVRCSKF